jgi:hypothetical protein
MCEWSSIIGLTVEECEATGFNSSNAAWFTAMYFCKPVCIEKRGKQFTVFSNDLMTTDD